MCDHTYITLYYIQQSVISLLITSILKSLVILGI